jgi:glycerol kinase
MLYNIHEDKWDEELISKINIPKTLLPRVIPSNANFGSTDLFKDLIHKELPILAVLGDQQAAAYAYNNETKITYGTGTFIMMPVNNSESGNLLMTSAYKTQSKKALALEGSVFVGGSIVQWLRDGLGIISNSSEIEALANSVPDNGGVYLIPALAGLGAPFWREDVNGTIFGITRATTKAHIARAALESIAYRVRDILDSQTRQSISSINVDGGASKNDTLMQFQADLLQIPIKRYTETEMTALGAARMTGEVELKLQSETIFKPQKNLDKQYKEWQSYINKLL